MELLNKNEWSEIVNEGTFGKNVSFVSFEQNKDFSGKDQFMSIVVFGTVVTSDSSRYPVLIKFKPRDNVQVTNFGINRQFHNEKNIYERFIPFVLKYGSSIEKCVNGPLLAKFFYCRNKCGEFSEKDIIIVENVSPLGFRLSEERLFLDYEHLHCALQSIAKFHAMSYIAKHRDPIGFREVIKYVGDTKFHPGGKWRLGYNALYRFSKRGLDRLLERDGDRYKDNKHLHRFNELIVDQDNSLRRALTPREPMSVMCHGDFCRNNVLFRYNDDGIPVHALLFDFGTPRYGSPALDLSFFLYMNTSRKMREDRWDDLLDTYCATLAECVPSGVPVPGRADLDAEMAASALYGFADVSFFLPIQSYASGIENLFIDNDDERITKLLTVGGDVETEYVADVVQHLIDMGYTKV